MVYNSYICRFLKKISIFYLCDRVSKKICLHVTSWVNFTYFLHEAFTLVDPESVKNTVKSSVSFYAFGICGCKSGRRTFMKLTPWVVKVVGEVVKLCEPHTQKNYSRCYNIATTTRTTITTTATKPNYFCNLS